uniref:Uncharacterized protein n=1 Tax=Rhizophora mucronata TaxID=61149 RepID=A0A2P2R312_RHIMU
MLGGGRLLGVSLHETCTRSGLNWNRS